jgi:hypothetical protein
VTTASSVKAAARNFSAKILENDFFLQIAGMVSQ